MSDLRFQIADRLPIVDCFIGKTSDNQHSAINPKSDI